MTQYWKNGVFCTNVSESEAQEIIQNAKNAGWEVHDKTMPNHFSIEGPRIKKGHRKGY